MSTPTIIIFVIVIAIVALIALRSGGPRVTQIDRTIRKDKDHDDA
jgi:hypothetical protein